MEKNKLVIYLTTPLSIMKKTYWEARLFQLSEKINRILWN